MISSCFNSLYFLTMLLSPTLFEADPFLSLKIVRDQQSRSGHRGDHDLQRPVLQHHIVFNRIFYQHL